MRASLRSARVRRAVAAVLAACTVVLAVGPGGALALPQMGHRFYGAAIEGPHPAFDGAKITAEVGGVTYPLASQPQVLVVDGKYGYGADVFQIPADDPSTPALEGARPGDPIKFFVDGTQATLRDESTGLVSTTYPFAIGGLTNLTLEIPDTRGPVAESVAPADGAAGVAVDAAVTVTFSEDVALADPAGAGISIKGLFAGQERDLLDGVPTVEGNVLTIPHKPFLASGEKVTVTIEAGAVQDLATPANGLAEALQWTFSSVDDSTPHFTDVPKDHWAYRAIDWIYHAGITTGYGDGRFGPEDTVTRAQMAAFLGRAMGLTECKDCEQTFTDVPPTHWAFGWVEAIYQAGITTGYPDGRYGPDDTVTRAQMAAFLGRAKGLTPCPTCEQTFTDVPPTHWAFGWVEAIYQAGITTGYGDGRYGPEDTVTRAQMATFLARTFLGF